MASSTLMHPFVMQYICTKKYSTKSPNFTLTINMVISGHLQTQRWQCCEKMAREVMGWMRAPSVNIVQLKLANSSKLTLKDGWDCREHALCEAGKEKWGSEWQSNPLAKIWKTQRKNGGGSIYQRAFVLQLDDECRFSAIHQKIDNDHKIKDGNE